MTISARDKKILMLIVPLVVVVGYWFMLLAPKREAASEAAATLETEQAALMDAQTQATTVEAAKANFARDYATVIALGKAIPTSVDMPSLLVQLEQAAKGTGIELDGVTMGERTAASQPAASTGSAAAPDPSQPGAAPSGEEPASAPGEAAATAQDAADTASTPPPTADPTGDGATDSAAPAAGGLESVGMEFDFKGDFFELADFFHRLKRFVHVDGERVRVRGRLMTIDAVEYTADADSFPALTATVTATVFLTPKAEGVSAGASPAGPASAASTPVATADSDPSSPTPTATATP